MESAKVTGMMEIAFDSDHRTCPPISKSAIGAHHPKREPSLSEKTSRNMPDATSAAPGTSILMRRPERAVGRMKNHVPNRVRGAMITLIPNDHRHE